MSVYLEQRMVIGMMRIDADARLGRCRRLTAAGLVLVAAATAAAATEAESAKAGGGSRSGGWTFHMDNDVLYSRYNEDRNYTGGFGFERASTDKTKFPRLMAPARALDRWADGRLTPSTSGGRTFYSVLFATTAFTPENLSARQPLPNDRPYCSLFFVAGKVVAVNSAETFARTSEIGLGVLGLPIAGEVQAFVHEYITPRSPEPRGWDNQISDGGEPTAFARLAVNRRLLSFPAGSSPRIQLAAQAETVLGYQTYAAVGSTLRFGRINSPFWGFDPNPLGVGTRKAPGPEMALAKAKSGATRALQELYLFVAARGSGVVYNAALQGQFRDSRVRFGGSEIERFIYEVHGGVAMRLWRTTITYALHVRAPEFEGPEARRHYWAGLYISRSLRKR